MKETHGAAFGSISLLAPPTLFIDFHGVQLHHQSITKSKFKKKI